MSIKMMSLFAAALLAGCQGEEVGTETHEDFVPQDDERASGDTTVTVDGEEPIASAATFRLIVAEQDDGTARTSLSYQAIFRRRNLQFMIAIPSFQEGMTTAALGEAAELTFVDERGTWSATAGEVEIGASGEDLTVSAAGSMSEEDGTVRALRVEIAGKVSRECWVLSDVRAQPRAMTEEGDEAAPELVPDFDWEAEFCQGQR